MARAPSRCAHSSPLMSSWFSARSIRLYGASPMDKMATAPSMTVVSAALSLAAGPGCFEVFGTAIFQCSMVSLWGPLLAGRQAEEGGSLID